MYNPSTIPGALHITRAKATSSASSATVTTATAATPMHTTEVVATARRLTITSAAADKPGPSGVETIRTTPDEVAQNSQTSPAGNINAPLSKKLKRVERNATTAIEDMEGLQEWYEGVMEQGD